MDTFLASSCGTLVMVMCQGLLTAPSWQTFTRLACGWVLASGRHPMTAYVWLTGAVTVKHCSRFYVCLGCPFSNVRWQGWARIIRHAASLIPADAPIVIEFDETTKKKAGTQIEGVARYRHGAGSARQAYRPLRGVNFVWGVMCVPLRRWPGHSVTVPIGVELYLQAEQAHQDNVPARSRSARARQIVDFVAAQLPGRTIRGLTDGGDATKEFLRELPPAVDVITRWLIAGKLYALAPKPPRPRRGRPPPKGPLLGAPNTWVRKRHGWQPHPTEVGAEVQAWIGLWHTVLPGQRVPVVVVPRPPAKRPKQAGQRKPPPTVEACFTTDMARSVEALLPPSRDRGAVESMIRDRQACEGLGQDQCRKVRRMVGANTCRLAMAATRTLGFLGHVSRRTTRHLQRYRPWDRQKRAPRQLDIVWACREALHEAGIFPIPRFAPDLAKTHEEPENTLPSAA